MTTHFNYSHQNFSMNNAKVLTGNSQPVPDITFVVKIIEKFDKFNVPFKKL